MPRNLGSSLEEYLFLLGGMRLIMVELYPLGQAFRFLRV